MDKIGFGERAIVSVPGTSLGGAVLKINEGKQTDTIFHRLYGKIIYVLSGKLRATVMKDGKVNAVVVNAGASFFVKPGLVHNFYGIEETALVEFASTELYEDDVYCVFKGTMPEEQPEAKPDDVMKMTEDDKSVDLDPEPKTKKKKTRKKAASKRKAKTKKTKKQ